jgi:hypothetical protein
VQSKAVETSYNYYGITAENIGDKIGIVLISLVFYVVYTLWYGFGILYLFEGFGHEPGALAKRMLSIIRNIFKGLRPEYKDSADAVR